MKCCKCDADMIVANLQGDGAYSSFIMVTKKKKSIFDTGVRCEVDCHVCPECGYIELYAHDLQKLKDLR
jgi:hypothetical protein